MRNRLAADRYANALVQSLEGQEALERALTALQEFAAMMTDHPDLAQTLENPAVRFETRAAILDDVLNASDNPPEVVRLLKTLHTRGRIRMVGDVADAFSRRIDERLGRATAQVTSAAPLKSDMIERLRASLERHTGKTVRVVATVDPDLLGGVRARIGDKVLDGSIRARLRQMREHLIAEETRSE